MVECEDSQCDITGEPIEKIIPKVGSKRIKPLVSCDFTGKEGDNCKDLKIEMITQKGCSWCDYAKENLKKAKVDKRITEIDVGIPNVKEYIKKGWVEGTPSFIINEINPCDLKRDNEKDRLFLQCKNGKKVYL